MKFDMQRMAYEDAPYIILYYNLSLQAYRTDRFEGWVTDQPVGVVLAYNRGTYMNLRPIGAGEEKKKTGIETGMVVAGFALLFVVRWLRRDTSW
jgi:hypothetical protein